MAALTALRPKVQPHVSGCPLPVIDDAILDAVIDFCNRSRAYRFTPAEITVVASTANYTVSGLPTGTEIAWLLAAEYDDLPIDTPDTGSIPQSWATEEGEVTAAVMYSATQIGLRKVPDEAQTLNVRLALRPSLAATTFPDEFNALYREQIAAGALARLYAMPKQPWSAPELVADCRNQFDDCILAAEFRADRGSAAAPARTTLSLIGGH
jgi:hypothetical protein